MSTVTDTRTGAIHEVYGEVEQFVLTVSTLMRRVQPVNSLDYHNIFPALHRTLSGLHFYFRHLMENHDPGPDGSYDEKVRYNMSRGKLKEEARFLRKKLWYMQDEWYRKGLSQPKVRAKRRQNDEP